MRFEEQEGILEAVSFSALMGELRVREVLWSLSHT